VELARAPEVIINDTPTDMTTMTTPNPIAPIIMAVGVTVIIP
jgi:hypothetical protein